MSVESPFIHRLEAVESVVGVEPGTGDQSVVVKFVDGRKVFLTFKYFRAVAPFCTPAYTIFNGAGSTTTVRVFFPTEVDVSLLTANLPDEVEILQSEVLSTEKQNSFEIQLNLVSEPKKRGVLQFQFSSTEKPSIEIPYLYNH